MSTVLITGANRGLGREFVRQLVKEGHRVLATCRDPSQARKLKRLVPAEDILTLDVSRPESIEKLPAAWQGRVNHLDGLINNAGVGGKGGGLNGVTWEDCQEVFATNVLGPLLVTRTCRPLLKRGSRVMNITSLMGSLADNRSGGGYSYRISKAALNMVTNNLHIDLSPQGIIVISMHPGWVRTRMGGPAAPLSKNRSVAGMLAVYHSMTPQEGGGFFNFKGESLPW